MMAFMFGNFITAYGIPSPKVVNTDSADDKENDRTEEKLCAHCGAVVGLEEKVCKTCGKALSYIEENGASKTDE